MRAVTKYMFAAVFLLMPVSACFAQYDYIKISNPFLHKIPIAVPMFKPLSESQVARETADRYAVVMSDALEFTRYFTLIDRDAFIDRPRQTGITLHDINFKNWRDIGAEYLVTGGVSVVKGVVEMEFRLFDVFKGQMLAGKRYRGQMKDRRRIVLRFCGEIMEKITGNRGCFQSKIAFVSSGDGNKEIYICDFDGHNPVRITKNKSINLSPAWSSDGRALAWTSYKLGRPDLYIMNLLDRRVTRFSMKGVNISPAWVPGKFMLAATLSFEGDQEIYLITGSGKVVRRLTWSWGIDVSPSFSPDGKRMAFVSNRSGTPQIYLMYLDTGRTERLTFDGRYNTNPSWNPVDDRIAYCAMENGVFNIKVIDVATRKTVSLTAGQGDNESPCWSPDGSLIVFSSTRDGGVPRIYVMSAVGTDAKRLLVLPGEQTSPRWSPAVAVAGR